MKLLERSRNIEHPLTYKEEKLLTEEENVVKTNAVDDNAVTLVKSIDWKQGVIIAMGVPILILPGIYDIAGSAYALSIFIWTMSVVQGFCQNLAIGEMSATLQVPGIGGCAQTVFTKENPGKYDLGKFLGAFTAWSYWFTWTPVIPIFTIMTGTYLQSFIDPLADINSLALNLFLGVIIYGIIIIIGAKGLEGGSRFGLILALVTIVPLLVVISIPFVTGDFQMSNITNELLPPGWDWGTDEFITIFGCFAYAQWCACAWESVATYGAEYKNPGKDLPKGLYSAGLICLLVYALVSLSVFGCLGYTGIEEEGIATLVPIAIMDFGDIGSSIALFLLVAGMVMLIQTAFLGSSRTLYFMGHEGNMPKFFAKTNKRGAPIFAMAFQFVVGMCMIPLGQPGMILAASSFGFCFALGMAMVAFIFMRTKPRFKDLERPWKAPRGWFGVAVFIMIYQFFILIPCLAMWSMDIFGFSSVIIGVVILAAYIPIWFILQALNTKKNEEVVKNELDA